MSDRVVSKNLPVSPRLLIGILSLLFLNALVLNFASLGPGGEAVSIHVFWKGFLNARLHEFSLPGWNPYVMGGVPFAAWLNGVFYPGSLIYLFFPAGMGLNVDFIVHVILAGWFMSLMVQDCKFSRSAGALAGIIWAFNGLVVGYFSQGRLQALNAYAWLPLVLMCWRRLLNGGDLKNAAYLGLALGVQFLAGHMQFFFCTVGVCLFYSLWWCVDMVRRRRLPVRLAMGAGWVGLGAVMALGLMLIQLLPYLELSGNAVTVFPPHLADASAPGPLPPWNLIMILAPSVYGNLNAGVYFGKGAYWDSCAFVGIWTLLLAILSVRHFRRMPGGWFFPVLAGLGIVLSLGSHTAPFKWLIGLLPFNAPVVEPALFMMVFVFAAAVMAGCGFEVLLGRRHAQPPEAARKALKVGMGIGFGLVIIGILLFMIRNAIWELGEPWFLTLIRASGQVDPATTRTETVSKALTYIELNLWDLVRTSLVVFLGCHVILAFEKRAYGRKALSIIIPLVVFAELFLFAQPHIGVRAFTGHNMGRQIERAVAAAELGGRDPFRVFVPHGSFYLNEGALVGLESIDGRGGFMLENYARLLDDFYRSRGRDRELRAAGGAKLALTPGVAEPLARLNVRYMATSKPLDRDDPAWTPENWKLVSSNGVTVYRNRLHSSYAYFEPGPGALADGFHYETLERSTELVRVRVRSEAPGTVVFRDIYYPAWKARVNGEPRPLFEVDGLLRGVEIGAGTHIIEMRYSSTPQRIGAAVSLAALLLMVGIIGWHWFRAIKERNPAAQGGLLAREA